MRDHLRLLWLFFQISFQDDAAYRGEFWMRLLFDPLFPGRRRRRALDPFFQHRRDRRLDIDQVLILIGTFHVGRAGYPSRLRAQLSSASSKTCARARSTLCSPSRDSQFLASFRRIVVAAAGERHGALLVGFRHLPVPEGRRLYTALPFLCAGLRAGVLYSFWLCLITLVFWFVRIENVTQIFWALFDAGRLSLDIYPGGCASGHLPGARRGVTTFPARARGRLSPGSPSSSTRSLPPSLFTLPPVSGSTVSGTTPAPPADGFFSP